MRIEKISLLFIMQVLFLLPFCSVSLAQTGYQLTSTALFSIAINTEGGLYVLKENGLYAVVKFNHTNYGPNSHTYDLLFFDKQSLQLKQLITFAEMEKDLIELTNIRLYGDTVETVGSRFLKKDNKRTAFKKRFVKGELTDDEQTTFPPEPSQPVKYKYFEDYECIGKLGDSAFAFSHRKIYATVSPWTQIDFFDQRKVYTYDYVKKDIKTYEFPKFKNSNKKVYEEVHFEKDSFIVTGLYTDTTLHSRITGIYQANLYKQSISYCPLMQLSGSNWVEKGIDEVLAWNKYSFMLDSCSIDIHELADQNFLIACYKREGAAWAKKISNYSTRGPYPNYARVGNAVIILGYDFRDRNGLLPVNKYHENEVVYVRFHYVSHDGLIHQLKGEPIKDFYDIYFYPESLMEIDSHNFGIFYYDKEKASLCLYKFTII